MDVATITSLALIAFLAGFFDAIAGGGGLITLPALIVAGINPVNAIATNKVQAASATISATVAFARKGMIDWRASKKLVIFSIVGGMIGATLVSTINKGWLQAAVPVLLILVAFYFLFSPSLKNQNNSPKVALRTFAITLAPALGAYDGFFGPGVGSFFLIGFVALCGFEIMRAMSFTKLANAACNLGSLSVFVLSGLIIWPVALSMAIASFLGAQLGARAAVRVGARLVKPMIVLVCFALAFKLLSDKTNPLNGYIFKNLVTMN